MSSDLDLRRPPPAVPLRHRRDPWVTAAIVAVVIALLAWTVTLTVWLTRDDNGQQPGPSPAPTASPSPSPSPTASPTPSPQPVPDEPIGAAWPLTTTREVEAWRANPSAHPYLSGAADTAMAFATRFLGIAGASVRRTPAGTYEITRPDPNGDPLVVTRAVVQPVGGRAPYVVRYALDREEMTVASPAIGATIASPLRARGTFRAVDPSFLVEVRAGQSVVGSARATYSPDGWAATVSYTTAARTGAVVVTNGALFGEGIASASVVPVVFGTVPLPAVPAAFAGVADGRIALFRTSDGARLRFLTSPAPGLDDYLPVLNADRTRVRFTRGGAVLDVRTDGSGLRTLLRRATGPILAAADTSRGFAYVGYDTATARNDVVLRSATGTETRLGLYGFVQPWITASRGGRFVYVLTGASLNGPLFLRRIDVTRQLADVVVAPEAGYSWQTLSAGYAGGGVVAARYGGGASSVVVMDEALSRQRLLLRLGAADVSRLVPDRSGSHLLLWRTGTGGSTVVQRWITGNVVAIARGPASPAW